MALFNGGQDWQQTQARSYYIKNSPSGKEHKLLKCVTMKIC
jgi:hypothetical protein